MQPLLEPMATQPSEATPIVKSAADPSAPLAGSDLDLQLLEEQKLEQCEDWTPRALSADYWPTVVTTFGMMWPLLLGNVLEWYEFGAYGYVASEITDNFFSAEWITWVFFAVSFIMRPVGGLLYGVLGDRLGRKEATWWAIFGMSIATIAQGCLPSKNWGGEWGMNVGVCLLFITRMVQGLSTGGEIGGVITYMSESDSKETLGATISFVGATQNLAFAMSSLVVVLCHLALGDAAMSRWGWRIPFWLAAVPAYVCLTRLHSVPESSAFIEKEAGGAAAPPPLSQYVEDVRHLLVTYKREILLVFLALSSVSAFWYVGPLYGVTYAEDHGGSHLVATSAAMCSQLVAAFVALPVATFADRFGVGKVCLVGNATLMLVGLPLMAWLSADSTSNLVVWLDIGVLMGLAQSLTGSVCYLMVAELFPTSVRNAAAGLSYNLSVAIFGGCGPLYCSALDGSWDLFPGWYLSGLGAVGTAALLYIRWLRRQGLLRATHLRTQPY